MLIFKMLKNDWYIVWFMNKPIFSLRTPKIITKKVFIEVTNDIWKRDFSVLWLFDRILGKSIITAYGKDWKMQVYIHI